MRKALAAALLCLFASACGGTGACVSDAVDIGGLHVYCYNDWDEADCDEFQANNVNGANWAFHEGQTCADRGLVEGSNPWP